MIVTKAKLGSARARGSPAARQTGVLRAKRLLPVDFWLSCNLVAMKKRQSKYPQFMKRLEQALCAMLPELNRLTPFLGGSYDAGSGTHLSHAIYAKFGVELSPATVQRWINGQGYPSEHNWSLLVGLVNRSREWLKCEDARYGRSADGLEASETSHRYGDRRTRERLAEILREATRIVENDL
jgi:hypothetical protein